MDHLRGESYRRVLLFISICIAAFVQTAECINCVQCSSLLSTDCLKPNLTATGCQGSSRGAKYCLMYITLMSGMPNTKFIFRHCGSFRTQQPICRVSTILDSPARSCYLTCDSDGCNNDVTISGIFKSNQTGSPSETDDLLIDEQMNEFIGLLSDFIAASDANHRDPRNNKFILIFFSLLLGTWFISDRF